MQRQPDSAGLGRKVEKLSLLLEVMTSLATELDADRLLQLVMNNTTQILDADRSTLFLLDRERQELWSKVAQGAEVREIRVPANAGIAGYVARTGEVLNIPEAYDDPRFNREVDRQTRYRTKTILCMPLRDSERNITGVIQVLNKRDGVFTQEDEEFLAALCSQAAIALRNAALVEELRRRIQRTEILLDVMRSVSSHLELEPLLQAIIAKTTQVMNADRSSLFLVDFKTDELWSKVAQGLETTEIRFPKHLGLAGHVATTGEILNIPEAYDDPRFNREVDQRTGYRTKTILCVPIRDDKERIIGVTQVINKKEGVFTREDEDLLSALSSQASIAIENAQLFEEVVYMKNYNESILTSMATGVITMDLEGVVTTVNPAAGRIFGLGGQGEEGIHYRQLLLEEVNPGLVTAIGKVYETEQEYNGYDIKYLTASEDTVKMNLSVLPLRDRKERVIGTVLVADDITQEQRLMSTLVRYVTREIAERVLAQKGALKLGGERQKVTVLFSDIRSYTTLTERSTAEEVVTLLNEYFTRMVRAIFKYEGTLDKYIGDAIMAVFGAPLAHSDDALRAVKAAMEMRIELREFNQERVRQGKPPIEIGIGICNGYAISGNIGSEERMDYTVIGDAVNVSSRLEGLTKQYETKILFSDGVYEEVKDTIPCVAVGQETVKGREEPVRIYGLLDSQIPELLGASLRASGGDTAPSS